MGVSKLSLLALAGFAIAELQPITMKGQKFFYENGTQFYMKGVAYQQETAPSGQTNDEMEDYTDPLADEEACRRDIPLLEELGTNTIRTYAIDPEADHSACMQLLDEAGIYVISDLSQPMLSIKRDKPQWNTDLYKRYMAVVDELAQYSNVIGFFAGNEVSDAANNTEASAYVKAALRDTKQHILDQEYRWMGVGYASNDHPDIRAEIAQYFNCGDESEATDYWGYNIYSWCGESTMEDSGYNDQVEFFQDYPVPVFFAEYGCNIPDGAEGRIFQETEALYSDEMTGVFSGGIVYMYFQEENDYGLVEIEDGEAVKLDNFDALKREHLAADPTTVQEDEYEPSGSRQECPAIAETWKAAEALPPTPDEALCDCAVAASECRPVEDLDEEDFADIFDYVCGEMEDLCIHINGNATTGIYGAYSMCNDRAKLTYLLGAYYAEVGQPTACDFDGAAEVVDASAESSCDDALAAASSINEAAATATAPVGGSSTGGADAEDFGVTSAPIARLFALGDYAVGLYMVISMGVGGAMLLL